MSTVNPDVEKTLAVFNMLKGKIKMTHELEHAYQQLSAGFGDMSMIETLKKAIMSVEPVAKRVKSPKRGVKNAKRQGKSRAKASGK